MTGSWYGRGGLKLNEMDLDFIECACEDPLAAVAIDPWGGLVRLRLIKYHAGESRCVFYMDRGPKRALKVIEGLLLRRDKVRKKK